MSAPYAIAEAVPAEETLVEVTAPATLAAGYTFAADVNGRTITVTVPEGGVKEGQTFQVPVTMPSAPVGEATPLTTATYSTDTSIPRGHWKDSLCDCCTYGPCHPSLWNAICCPQLLMAQVLTRMNLNWLGNPVSPTLARKTFSTVVTIVVSYLILNAFLSPKYGNIDMDAYEDDEVTLPEIYAEEYPVQYFFYNLVNGIFGLYSLIVLMKLRAAIRNRYTLPNQTPCGGMCHGVVEDCCCAWFCGCCTVSQLARHTAPEYDERGSAMCCSNTGLAPKSVADLTPVLVV